MFLMEFGKEFGAWYYKREKWTRTEKSIVPRLDNPFAEQAYKKTDKKKKKIVIIILENNCCAYVRYFSMTPWRVKITF